MSGTCRGRRSRFGLLALAALAASLLPLRPACAEYRLQMGDTIEISAIGMPDLRQRAKINVDGQIALPLIGDLKVVGMSLPELRITLQKLLPTRFFRRTDSSQHEGLHILSPNDIVVDIVEYRPVYVDGDVAKPGEQGYRAGLTARQAIALAGGVDLLHLRIQNPLLESADLRSEHSALWIQFVKAQAHLLRLEAQLNGKNQFDPSQLVKAPLSAAVVTQIVRAETDQLSAADAEYLKEKKTLQQALAEANQHLGLLQQQLQRQQQEANVDAAEMERVRGLLSKGLATVARVSDERHAALLATTAALQTAAQLTQVKRDISDLVLKLQKLDDRRRITLLGEAEQAHVEIATLHSRLEAVREKLLYTGAVSSQLVRGLPATPTITIIRKQNGNEARIPADGETPLLPGDVVEVVMNVEVGAQSLTQ